MLFNKEFEFKGKYADYCRFLKNDICLFKTFREVYTTSAIIGFINSTKGQKDVMEKVQPASILPSELAQKRASLTFIYRLIMLTENNDLSIQALQNRTFRDDSDDSHPERVASNMELFNSYVLGGLEILYNKFKGCKTTKDVVNELNDYLLEFFEDNGLSTAE